MSKQRYVSADDINTLFYKPSRKRRSFSWQLISACFLIVLGIFTAINAPALGLQVNYWWNSDIQAASSQNVALPADHLPTVADKVVTPAKTQGQTFDPAQLPNNTIYIPKISTKAPVIWDVSAGGDLNSDMLTALQKGVARYPRTALPDQVGNVFLTGHSSNYWWDPGHYKTVFALLNRLVVGDVIYIKYQDKVYTYRVTAQKVVQPSETSVLAPTKTPTLSLMTCTPTGTSLLRRIVTADLISPKDGLTPQPTTPNESIIQSIR